MIKTDIIPGTIIGNPKEDKRKMVITHKVYASICVIYTRDDIEKGYINLPVEALPAKLKNITQEEFNSKYIFRVTPYSPMYTESYLCKLNKIINTKYVEANPIDTLDVSCDIDGDAITIEIYEKDEV